MGAVAEAVPQGVDDQVLLHLGDGLADEAAAGGFGGGHGGQGGARVSVGGGQGLAVRQADGVLIDLHARRQQHRAVHGVLELADIAGPAVGDQAAFGLVGQRLFRHGVGGGILLDEKFGHRHHIARPLTQRRQAQVHHVEPIEQVLTERTVLDGQGQVAVRGGQDADVHLHRLGPANPVDLAFLDSAQQLGLQTGVHLGDFVQQQGAAGGFLEFADPPGQRPGKGALLMAEQFAFQQVFGDGGAVHRDERPVRAARLLMDVARDDFLADAALAGDQDRGV